MKISCQKTPSVSVTDAQVGKNTRKNMTFVKRAATCVGSEDCKSVSAMIARVRRQCLLLSHLLKLF